MARKRELTMMASRLMASLLIRLLYSCLCESPSTRSERTILDAERWTLGIHSATLCSRAGSRPGIFSVSVQHSAIRNGLRLGGVKP